MPRRFSIYKLPEAITYSRVGWGAFGFGITALIANSAGLFAVPDSETLTDIQINAMSIPQVLMFMLIKYVRTYTIVCMLIQGLLAISGLALTRKSKIGKIGIELYVWIALVFCIAWPLLLIWFNVASLMPAFSNFMGLGFSFLFAFAGIFVMSQIILFLLQALSILKSLKFD